MTRPATRELIDRIPEDVRDGYLLDLVDFYVAARAEGKDYAQDYMPQIERGSKLERKIVAYKEKIQVHLAAAREGDRSAEKRYAREGVNHDPDAWPRMVHDLKRQYGQEAALTDAERETIIKAALSHRNEEEDEDDAYAHCTLHFHRFHGEGWFARFRSQGEQEWDEDAPEYLDEALPFWDESLNWHDEPLDGRNYRLFAIMADVRNGVGFAGVDTGDRVEPVSEPRGIPEDASPEVKKFMDSYGIDGHSHTYHTLRQLKEYPWDEDSVERGIVSALDYERMKEQGYPEKNVIPPGSISGGISGGGIVTFTAEGYEEWKKRGFPYLKQPETSMFMPDISVTPELLPDADAVTSALAAGPGVRGVRTGEEFDQILADTQVEKKPEDAVALLTPDKTDGAAFFDHQKSINGVHPHVHVEWRESRRDEAGSEFWGAVEKLSAYAEEHGISEDDVRICMFFDN